MLPFYLTTLGRASTTPTGSLYRIQRTKPVAGGGGPQHGSRLRRRHGGGETLRPKWSTWRRPAESQPLHGLGGARALLGRADAEGERADGGNSDICQEVRPFTDEQIELLENFAAQAVIAIENARLLNELRQRTDDLTESLEQQTATAEVLKVISGSPAIFRGCSTRWWHSAARLCGATSRQSCGGEGDIYHLRASTAITREYREGMELSCFGPPRARGRTRHQTEGTVVHIEDLRTDAGYIGSADGRVRSAVSAAMLGRPAPAGGPAHRRHRALPAPRSGPLPTSRSSWSRPSPTRR